jgi:alkyl hydroperoxide reductase subunit AhpC
MSLRINDLAPDFTAETTQGPVHFHEWIGDGWAVLFSHPKDFTPVCTTELGAVAGLEKQFAERGAKVIGLSVDPVSSHSKWTADIQEVGGHAVNYPLIGDPELKIAKLYDMLAADSGDTSEGRTPANNAPVRTVFVIGPDKRIKLTLAYPMTTGRNFDEIIRVLDSIQLTAKHRVGKVDQIFDAFFTTKPQGSGMGLAICRSIVDSHGGDLWATSNEGRGAAFHFALPAAPRETNHPTDAM